MLAVGRTGLKMLPMNFLEKVKRVVGPDGLLTSRAEMVVYEADGINVLKNRPDAVVLPSSTDEVSKLVKLCNEYDIPFVPRGAGTGLSGGSSTVKGGVMLCLNRMNRIIEVDISNEMAVVEAGLVNLWLSQSVSKTGYYYVPDPSSAPACTIGGNIAHNAGGAHCLKYGVTTNHVLGVEVVLPDGEVVWLGGKVRDLPGYDLTGIMVGSEGTLGIVTKAVVKLTKKVEAVRTFLGVFDSIEDASSSVSEVIASGIIPGAIEMMDNLSIRAVEASLYAAGFPKDAGAILLIDIDGLSDGLETLGERIKSILARNRARDIRTPGDEQERVRWWNGRKQAFGAMGRISPNCIVEDGVIPRSKLPEVMKRVKEIGDKYCLRVANVFHAGDGNLHPLILFDSRQEGIVERAIEAGEEILKVCVDMGGSITGEHGVGLMKKDLMSYQFSNEDLEVMVCIREVFNPSGLLNPGKVLPTSKTCAPPLQTETRTIARGW